MKPIWRGRVMGKPVSVYRRVVPFMDDSDDGCCRKWGNGYIVSIRPGLGEKRELEIAIHELLHAADWFKDEEWIEETAQNLADALNAMGWTRAKNEQVSNP